MSEKFYCIAPIFTPSCKEPYSRKDGCLSEKPCNYKKTRSEMRELIGAGGIKDR